MKTRLIPAIALLAPLSGFAADDKKTTTDIELGFISTSGNTASTSLTAKANVKQNLERVNNTFVAEILFKEDEVATEENGLEVKEKVKTAEKLFLSAQTDLKLNTEHRGLFFYGSYEDDKFSGFEYQGTLAIGYSDRLFTREDSYLKYSIGPGVAFAKTEDTVEDNGDITRGETSEDPVLRLAAEYFYAFNENAKFTQTLSTDYAFDSDANTKTKSVSALTANLSQSFALKASLTVTNNSDVPKDREKTDTQTAVTLVYSF